MEEEIGKSIRTFSEKRDSTQITIKDIHRCQFWNTLFKGYR